MPKIQGQSLAEHREHTRRALFDSLNQLMERLPFDKITLSDVATKAGVGRTAVYNHFSDKEDLLLAFMEHEALTYSQELAAVLATSDDPLERLRMYVRQQALVRRSYHFPAFGPLMYTVSRGTAAQLRQHGEMLARTLHEILTEAMDAGVIPAQDPAALVPLIHACVMGGRPTPTAEPERSRYLDTLDAFVLGAVGARVRSLTPLCLPDHHASEPVAHTSMGRCPISHVA